MYDEKAEYLRRWRRKPLGKLHTKKDVISSKLRKDPTDKKLLKEYLVVLDQIRELNDRTLKRNPKAKGNFIWTTMK